MTISEAVISWFLMLASLGSIIEAGKHRAYPYVRDVFMYLAIMYMICAFLIRLLPLYRQIWK